VTTVPPAEFALPGGAATGVGSMPGENFAETTRIVRGELPDLLHLPELPARGVIAGITGRSLALLVDLGADLQPAGWRLTDAPGVDHRRARSLLAQDLDVFEEETQGYVGPVKVQACGPWTLAATVERPRGDRLLADRGARRDLAQSLAEGVRGHVEDVRRRLPDSPVIVQLDEPSLVAVLDGAVPTASGFHRHRSVDTPAASEALGWVVDGVTAAGAYPIVHCCDVRAPVPLLRSAGAQGLSIDARLIDRTQFETYAEAVDAGITLWLGLVPAVEPAEPTGAGAETTDADLTRRALQLWRALGFAEETMAQHCVITPTCGLAGASPPWAMRALQLARTVAGNVGDAGQD
jgi:hypothetical protein